MEQSKHDPLSIFSGYVVIAESSFDPGDFRNSWSISYEGTWIKVITGLVNGWTDVTLCPMGITKALYDGDIHTVKFPGSVRFA